MAEDSGVVVLLKRLAPYALALTIGGAGAGQVYSLHRIGDLSDGYVEVKRQESEMIRAFYEVRQDILIAIKDKEKACEVLQASVTNGKYTHNYCKDGN